MQATKEMTQRGERNADALRAASERLKRVQSELDTSKQAERKAVEQSQHLKRQGARAERLMRQKEELEAQLTSMRKQQQQDGDGGQRSMMPSAAFASSVAAAVKSNSTAPPPPRPATAPRPTAAAAPPPAPPPSMAPAISKPSSSSSRGHSTLGSAAEAAATISLQRALAHNRAELARTPKQRVREGRGSCEPRCGARGGAGAIRLAAASAVERCLMGCAGTRVP